MSKQEPQQGWTHLVAGTFAGSAAVLFLHPFDVVKTRLQVQDGIPGQRSHYKGTRDAVRTILRQEGWKGLYAGLGPALLGSGISWGAYLYLYERVKSFHKEQQGISGSGAAGELQAGEKRLSMGWNLLSAAQAGAMVCLLTNPIWLIKTRLALQQRTLNTAASAAAGLLATPANTAAAAAEMAAAAPKPYKGIADAFVRIGREEGFRGYYKGLGPSLVLQTAHGAIQFAVYEELKHAAAGWGRAPGEPEQPLSSLQVSACGALSKLVAAVSTYPTQVVRSRLQQRFEGRALVYNSTAQVIRLTWTREGVLGFYKGIVPSLLRVMPQSAITLVFYEHALRLLKGLDGNKGSGAADKDAVAAEAADAADAAAEAVGPGVVAAAAAGQQQAHRSGAGADAQREQQQQERLESGKQRQRQAQITDGMRPLVIAGDSQAEQ